MKTTAQILIQENRISRLLNENSTNRINEADPRTGGSYHLCHNWGNEESRKYLNQFMERQSKIYNLFQRHYKRAFAREYPTHLMAGQYANA